MKTYNIFYDFANTTTKEPFKVGDKWLTDLSDGDINKPLSESYYPNLIELTLPITCRTNEDFYNLYPEYLL
jgi:hypothetical protein